MLRADASGVFAKSTASVSDRQPAAARKSAATIGKRSLEKNSTDTLDRTDTDTRTLPTNIFGGLHSPHVRNGITRNRDHIMGRFPSLAERTF